MFLVGGTMFVVNVERNFQQVESMNSWKHHKKASVADTQERRGRVSGDNRKGPAHAVPGK